MRFASDATLGKLGRQLRAAGFDTLCQHQSRHEDFFDRIDPRRVILTRTTAIRARFQHRRLILIRDNDPRQQMMQVIRKLGLRQHDLKPFSRCLICNTDIHRADREIVRGRVPDYVWQRHQTFHACSNCKRIFWAGSHRERLCRRFEAIFQQEEEICHEK